MSVILAVRIPKPIAFPINQIINVTDKFSNKLRYRNYTNDIEQFASDIIKNPKLQGITVAIMGTLAFTYNVLASPATPKISQAGTTMLTICRDIGYWAGIVMCSVEIIKSLMQGNVKGIAAIISKYVLAYGALFLLPWLFDLIKVVFN